MPDSTAMAVSETNAKLPRSRKVKGKGKESAGKGAKASTQRPPSSNFVTAADLVEGKQLSSVTNDMWSWATVADSTMSDRPAVFTADGR